MWELVGGHFFQDAPDPPFLGAIGETHSGLVQNRG